jgi:O-antigen ligase
MIGLLVLLASIWLVRWLPARLMRGSSFDAGKTRVTLRWLGAATVAGIVILYVGVLAGGAYGLSRYDARMRRLFDFSALREQSFIHYANQLVFAERIVFWQAGWEVYNDYPLLGVGPGNAGFFFPKKLSAFSWALTEVRTLMYQWSTLPNIKSLWIRLLAETGIIGFVCFLCWLYVLWHAARAAFSDRETGSKLVPAAGLAGMLGLAAFVVEGFSLDTFALPYYWILFGMATAACQWSRRDLARRNHAG